MAMRSWMSVSKQVFSLRLSLGCLAEMLSSLFILRFIFYPYTLIYRNLFIGSPSP